MGSTEKKKFKRNKEKRGRWKIVIFVVHDMVKSSNGERSTSNSDIILYSTRRLVCRNFREEEKFSLSRELFRGRPGKREGMGGGGECEGKMGVGLWSAQWSVDDAVLWARKEEGASSPASPGALK